MNLRKSFAAIGIAAALAGGMGVVSAAPASAATSGVNVAGWCMSPARGMFGSVSTGARATNPGNAFSWECTTKNWVGATVRQSGVDMNAACRWLRGSKSYAALASTSNAYSWYCVY